MILEGKPEQNVLKTSTISLLDKHIERATLHGLQAHFHAPSEHTIDGKLLDLEMHVVHQLDPSLTQGDNKSTHSHGVLGFFFKTVTDDYFEQTGTDDFHDQFLNNMLDEKKTELDLTKFTQKLNYGKRWTYSGSLTTTPYSEGILWNVIEQVILIRQSTLDKFVVYREIQKSHIIGPFANEQQRLDNEAMRAHEPASIKPYRTIKGDTFFRFAYCNRVVQDQNDRPVYHIEN